MMCFQAFSGPVLGGASRMTVPLLSSLLLCAVKGMLQIIINLSKLKCNSAELCSGKTKLELTHGFHMLD